MKKLKLQRTSARRNKPHIYREDGRWRMTGFTDATPDRYIGRWARAATWLRMLKTRGN